MKSLFVLCAIIMGMASSTEGSKVLFDFSTDNVDDWYEVSDTVRSVGTCVCFGRVFASICLKSTIRQIICYNCHTNVSAVQKSRFLRFAQPSAE